MKTQQEQENTPDKGMGVMGLTLDEVKQARKAWEMGDYHPALDIIQDEASITIAERGEVNTEDRMDETVTELITELLAKKEVAV